MALRLPRSREFSAVGRAEMTIVFRLIDRETGKALGQKQGADQVAGKGRADQREQQKGGDIPLSRGCQEQIQMITMAIGRAAPNAPPIIKANADSRFASACTSYLDIPLLHRAPAPWARWMRMVKKRLTGSQLR